MKTLGKYHILEELGKGGFATVYKAKDPDLDRAVALKVMEPLLMRDPVWVKRFRQEARAIAQLKHPHIITIYEIGQAEGILFIAMELAEDGSLEDRLQQGPLPWAQTLELAQQIAAALDHAHARGIIHRDLKPANILLDPDVGAILTDFGFARLVADHSLSVTMSGGMVGTPSYIPPEVWRGQRADRPADVYALGAIVYEMITGQKRFDAPSPPAVMMAHFSPPPWPEAWPEDVPPGVVDVLARAMAQDPNSRFETAGELVEVLAGLEVDRLAEPYAELEAAIAAGAWQQALALVDTIKASDPDYRDVAALEQRALAGMEAEARRAQALQWKQAAEEALAAGNLDAAELALVQWANLNIWDDQRRAIHERLEQQRTKLEQNTPLVEKTSAQRDAGWTLAEHWREATMAALEAGNMGAAEQALRQWKTTHALEEERLALLGRLEELKAKRAQKQTETTPKPAAPYVISKSRSKIPSLVDRMIPETVLVPAGEFLMGSDNIKDTHSYKEERPQHVVFLDAFEIGVFPVTNQQYAIFVKATGREAPRYWPGGRIPEGREYHPVVYVSWHDAVAYCHWLSEKTGQVWRLPTEAEWEKAARGIDGRIYPWGNQKPNKTLCNYNMHVGRTTQVGKYPDGVSPFGIYDMAGNVWEWCMDWYDATYYAKSPKANPTGPNHGKYRVLRGGAWNSDFKTVRSAFRHILIPTTVDYYFGFRCVLSTENPPT